MKFKYYLRGLGIGILISTIILSISFAMKKNDLSDDEIIARAKELGMVMEDTGKDTIPKATETEDEIPKSTEDGFNTEQTDMQPGTTDSGEISQDVGTDGADAVPPSQDGTNMVQKEFVEKDDFLPMDGEKNSSVVLTDGDFLICYPSDGHRTAVQVQEPETIKKAIFKVKI